MNAEFEYISQCQNAKEQKVVMSNIFSSILPFVDKSE